MDQVITFDKSLQVRLQEYSELFGTTATLSVSQIRKEWMYFLELSLDSSGWQAIWKIPRLTCEQLRVSFPTIVLVYVEDIDFEQFTSSVKIIAVQDDLSLPEKTTVSLLQVWPTREQDPTIVLNLKTTANALDMLRFFYNNLFMPWDHEEDNTTDWVTKHLETRLRLFYDMKNGVIPRGTAEHLHSLLTEVRRLQAKREFLETDLEADDAMVDLDPSDEKEDNGKVGELMDIFVRILQIKAEVEILENPLMRDILIRRQNKFSLEKTATKPYIWMIFEEGKIDDYLNFLNHANEQYSNKTVKFASSLASTLEIINATDTILLNKSTHLIRTTGGLENGGVLKGIYGADDTTLTSTNENIMLDFSGMDVVVENVTINANFSQCAVLVRRGKTTFRNCKIFGDGESTTHQGIIVLAGSCLELVDCQLFGFGSAIIGNTGANIKMTGCEVHTVNVGIKTYDNCTVTIENCSFRRCKHYGICVETEKDGGSVGDFEGLNDVIGITIRNVVGEDIGKANVTVNRKFKIHPILDLFGDKNNKKESVSSIGDDLMIWNEVNTTVIEKDDEAVIIGV